MAGTLVIDTLKASSGVLATQNGMTGIAKAWVNFNQGTSVINGSFNVSSVTLNSTGISTINFTTAMPNANYTWAGSCGYGVGGQTNWLALPSVAVSSAMTTTTLQVQNSYQNNTSNTNIQYIGVIVFGA